MSADGGSALAGLLAHRPPMVMLSEVVSLDAAGSARAVADVSDGSIFYDPELGGVPACAAIEYMAQTVALAVGAARRARRQGPKVGFLLGTRRMDVATPAFRCGARYEVSAKCAYADEEFASFDCEIVGPGGETVASASLTAFQPPGDPERFAEDMRMPGERGGMQ